MKSGTDSVAGKVALLSEKFRALMAAGHLSIDDYYGMDDALGIPVFLRSDGQVELAMSESGEVTDHNVIDAINRGCALVGTLAVHSLGQIDGKFATQLAFHQTQKATEVFGDQWLKDRFAAYMQNRAKKYEGSFQWISGDHA